MHYVVSHVVDFEEDFPKLAYLNDVLDDLSGYYFEENGCDASLD
jgi:hypothetical protein